MWPTLQVEMSSSSGVSSNRSSSDLQRLLQPEHHPAVPSCLSLSGPATSNGQPGDTAEQAGPAIPASPFSQPCTQDAGDALQSSPSLLSYQFIAGLGLRGGRSSRKPVMVIWGLAKGARPVQVIYLVRKGARLLRNGRDHRCNSMERRWRKGRSATTWHCYFNPVVK